MCGGYLLRCSDEFLRCAFVDERGPLSRVPRRRITVEVVTRRRFVCRSVREALDEPSDGLCDLSPGLSLDWDSEDVEGLGQGAVENDVPSRAFHRRPFFRANLFHVKFYSELNGFLPSCFLLLSLALAQQRHRLVARHHLRDHVECLHLGPIAANRLAAGRVLAG